MAIRLRDRQASRKALTMSGTMLKWTGLLLTCLSSLSVAVLQRGLLKMDSYSTVEEMTEALAISTDGARSLASMAVTCSLISAMALPLYAKLVYEGWMRMEEKKPFFLRLLLCALISEVPYDLAMSGTVWEPAIQNPAWGLFLCAAMLEVIRLPKPRSRFASGLLQVLIVAGALTWSLLLQVYLGPVMILLVTLFYYMAGNKTFATLGGALLTFPQFPAPLGMLVVHWYAPDEDREDKRPNLFYILYPAQLLVFGIIGLLLKNWGAA